MSVIDIILGCFLLFFLINGFRKGLIKSVLNAFGLIMIIILLVKFSKPLTNMLIVELGLQEVLAVIVAYILIILVITLVVRLISYLLKKILSMLNLGFADRILGMIFGFLNGVLIIALILLLLNLSPLQKSVREFTRDSIIVNNINHFLYKLNKKTPNLKSIKKPIDDSIKEVDRKIKDAV